VFLENSNTSFEALIAKSADYCNKPFKHSVVKVCGDYTLNIHEIDITVHILCRDCDGNELNRCDLELEIFNSNNQLVIVIAKLHFPNEPVLWSGSKDIWMDSKSGKKCNPPLYSSRLENLSNRIKNSIT